MGKELSDLELYFNSNTERRIHKWNHYFDIYEHHFSRFRQKEIIILEIGVSYGGSLQMWKTYFGEKAKIYGIDINPECKALEEDQIEIFIGSQTDRKFLRSIKKSIPKVDILIDDGGHTMSQQRTTFEELFDHVKDNGVYLCEDLMTSYWLRYGGGHKRQRTFIEYSKNFIDKLHAYHSQQRSLKVNDFTRSVNSIHYYDGVMVIEKKKREKPYGIKSGEVSYTLSQERSSAQQLFRKSALKILIFINQILRFFRLPGFILK